MNPVPFDGLGLGGAILLPAAAVVGSYNELGKIAEEQRDFETAWEWYLRVGYS